MIKKEIIEKANKYSIDFHSKLMDKLKDEHKIVGCNEISHMKRFNKIKELGDFRDKTILDVGCGLGEFYKFLMERNINADYYGIDINHRMIQKSKEKFPEIAHRFSVFDILVDDIGQKFDYIIVAGLLNLNFGGNINMEMTERLISQVHKHANIGYALSMLSSLSRNPNVVSFYYRHDAILSIITKFCNNFRLDHSYMPHDFIISCYINDFYST